MVHPDAQVTLTTPSFLGAGHNASRAKPRGGPASSGTRPSGEGSWEGAAAGRRPMKSRQADGSSWSGYDPRSVPREAPTGSDPSRRN
eukprot:8100158-Lingulodinium_polyedra.AAC.1